jgi:hypothetical protein
MRTTNLTTTLILAGVLAGAVHAGPAIACHWVAVPGSVFETLEPLRQIAMAADDSPASRQAALARVAQLRAAIKPGDAVSLLKAGFWITTLHDIGVARDTDGPALILKALELRPNAPEYQLFAALAFMHSDKAQFRKHWERARELAQPGSAAATNLKVVAGLYPNDVD